MGSRPRAARNSRADRTAARPKSVTYHNATSASGQSSRRRTACIRDRVRNQRPGMPHTAAGARLSQQQRRTAARFQIANSERVHAAREKHLPHDVQRAVHATVVDDQLLVDPQPAAIIRLRGEAEDVRFTDDQESRPLRGERRQRAKLRVRRERVGRDLRLDALDDRRARPLVIGVVAPDDAAGGRSRAAPPREQRGDERDERQDVGEQAR